MKDLMHPDDDRGDVGDGGGRGPVPRHDWYHLCGRGEDMERVARVVEFTDWLRLVDPELDRAMPPCWLHHPWLVLRMDALYIDYLEAYNRNGDRLTPLAFAKDVDDSVAAIVRWSKTQGLYDRQHAESCSETDSSLSPERAQARDLARREGIRPRYLVSWPWNETAEEFNMDEQAVPRE